MRVCVCVFVKYQILLKEMINKTVLNNLTNEVSNDDANDDSLHPVDKQIEETPDSSAA